MKRPQLQDSGIMEKQIMGEENVLQEQTRTQNTPKKPANRIPKIDMSQLAAKLKYLKNRKFQLSLVLLLVLVVIFASFMMLSKRTTQTGEKTVVKITIASPAPIPDPELEQAKKDVVVFNNDLDSLDAELNNIKFPQIDLDVKF